MKKKIFALVAAMTLVLGMGITASAADSPKAAMPSGQEITASTLQTYASTTTVTSTAKDAKVSATSVEAAQVLAVSAVQNVGASAKVLTMVDIKASEAGTFTVAVPGVVAGQKVTVLHLLADGKTVEKLPATATNGAVSFTMTTYSPVAIVTASSPATGSNSVALVLVAIAALSAAAFCAKKFAM